MGLKSILSAFKTNYTNIDLLPDEKLKIELYHSADLIAKGKSRIKITDDIRNKFTEYIDRICNCTVSAEPIQNIQKELSGLTDDIIPKKISDFLVNSKSVYKYIAIEDESLHMALSNS